jgi:hypothetical protein
MQVLEARYPLVTLSSITTIILHHVPSLFFPHHLSTIFPSSSITSKTAKNSGLVGAAKRAKTSQPETPRTIEPVAITPVHRLRNSRKMTLKLAESTFSFYSNGQDLPS